MSQFYQNLQVLPYQAKEELHLRYYCGIFKGLYLSLYKYLISKLPGFSNQCVAIERLLVGATGILGW